jgi:glutamyl-tRNA reductase
VLIALIASFHTRPLRVVERLSQAVEGPSLGLGLVEDGAAQGAIALATCNRFELYLDASNADQARAAAVAALSHRLSMPPGWHGAVCAPPASIVRIRDVSGTSA